jgi:hypothetical protein
MCTAGHPLFAKCAYATVDIQGVQVSPIKISDTVMSRGQSICISNASKRLVSIVFPYESWAYYLFSGGFFFDVLGLVGVFTRSGVDISCAPTALSAHCGFHSHLLHGVYVFGSTNSILTDIFANSNTRYGVYLNGVRNTALRGVRASGNQYGVLTSQSHYSMEGGDVSGNEVALVDTDTVSTSTVHGVRFHGNSIAGVLIANTGHAVNITSSWIYDNDYGVFIQNGRSDNFISECFIYNNAKNNILISSGDGNVVANCYVGIAVNGGCPDPSTIKVGESIY